MIEEKLQTSDTELVLQIAGYNSEAFEELYSRYSANIYTLIKEIVSGQKLSEKIILSVFKIFLKQIEFYDVSNDSLFTWLTLIAKNKSIDTLKRAKFGDDMPPYSNDYEVEFILPKLSHSIAPINIEAASEKIKSYKNHLTEVQNLVLSLVYFEGLDDEEIAKRLNLPVVIVKQKIQSIMGILMQLYAGQNWENESNKNILNLIKLDVLGCLSSDEKELFDKYKNEDSNFLWKELGEYQNLTALLSTVLTIDYPPGELFVEIKKIFQINFTGNEANFSVPVNAPVFTEKESKSDQLPDNSKRNDTIEKILFKQPESSLSSPFKKEETILAASIEQKPKINVENIVKGNIEKSEVEKLIVQNKYETIKTDLKPGIDNPIRISDNQTAVKQNVIDNKSVNAATPKMNNDIVQTVREAKPVMVKENISSQEKTSDSNSGSQEFKIKIKDAQVADQDLRSLFKRVDKVTQDKVLIPNSENPDFKVKFKSSPVPLTEIKPEITKTENVIQRRTLIPNSENLESRLKIKNASLPEKELKPVEKKSDTPVQNNTLIPDTKKSDFQIKIKDVPLQKKEVEYLIPVAKKVIENVKDTSTIENKSDSGTLNGWQKVEKESKPIIKTPEKIITGKTLENIPAKKTDDNKGQFNSLVKDVKSEFAKDETVNVNKTVVLQKGNPEIKLNNIQPSKGVTDTKSPAIRDDKHIIPAPSTEKVEPTNQSLKTSEVIKKETTPVSVKQEKTESLTEIKSLKDGVTSKTSLTDSINIDEILTNIDDIKSDQESLTESDPYEHELKKLENHSKRTRVVAAAVFVLVILTGTFLYLNTQGNPGKFESSTTAKEKINFSGNTNYILQNDSKEFVTNETQKTEETILTTEEKPVQEKDLQLPLPKISPTEENTYFALNEKRELVNTTIKESIQTAAAKTENIVPLKEEKKTEEEPAVFLAVEEMPELIGGINGLQSKIKYPELAIRQGVEGKVLVQAIVDENGKVISANTIKGIGAGCDEAALDAVLKSNFKPGKQRGKNVKVQFTIPIVFKK
jgi:RNA polymerase sigma factor (sigma-70 family)